MARGVSKIRKRCGSVSPHLPLVDSLRICSETYKAHGGQAPQHSCLFMLQGVVEINRIVRTQRRRNISINLTIDWLSHKLKIFCDIASLLAAYTPGHENQLNPSRSPLQSDH